MITIIACNPTFGAAYNLRKAFSLWEETRLITLGGHNLWPGEEDIILTQDNASYCRELIETSRFVMIAGAAGLVEALDILQPSKAHWVTFWTDTAYWNDAPFYNDLMVELKVKAVFAMMDLMSRAPKGAIPLCHPVEDVECGLRSNLLTIAHSPRTENKRHSKGTGQIERAVNRLYSEFPGLRYMTIIGLPWRDCLSLKSRAHIFIDQMPGPGMAAGLGRSGEEALALGSIVLTALHGEEYLDGFFPPPPVVKAYDEEQLYTELRRLCRMSCEELELMGTEGRAWAERYLLFPGWLDYVGSHLGAL